MSCSSGQLAFPVVESNPIVASVGDTKLNLDVEKVKRVESPPTRFAWATQLNMSVVVEFGRLCRPVYENHLTFSRHCHCLITERVLSEAQTSWMSPIWLILNVNQKRSRFTLILLLLRRRRRSDNRCKLRAQTCVFCCVGVEIED